MSVRKLTPRWNLGPVTLPRERSLVDPMNGCMANTYIADALQEESTKDQFVETLHERQRSFSLEPDNMPFLPSTRVRVPGMHPVYDCPGWETTHPSLPSETLPQRGLHTYVDSSLPASQPCDGP